MDAEDTSIGRDNSKRRRVDSGSGIDIPVSAVALGPAAVYSHIDRQMVGVKSYKRRSSSGRYNVRALEAIVGLAASGFFTPSTKKRKFVPPAQTALGFINVPGCPTKGKRKRYT